MQTQQQQQLLQQQQQQAGIHIHINPPPSVTQIPISSSGGNGSPINMTTTVGTPIGTSTNSGGASFPSWTEEELRLLEECMIRIPAEDNRNDLDRIIKISKIVKTKNIRDIAQKMRSLSSPVKS